MDLLYSVSHLLYLLLHLIYGMYGFGTMDCNVSVVVVLYGHCTLQKFQLSFELRLKICAFKSAHFLYHFFFFLEHSSFFFPRLYQKKKLYLLKDSLNFYVFFCKKVRYLKYFLKLYRIHRRFI